MKLSSGVPIIDEIMLPLLKAAADGPLTNKLATERVSEMLGLTPDQRAALMPRGSTYISDRVSWSRTYLGQAGLLRTVERGVFEITDRGREVLASKPERIDSAFLKRFPEFVDFWYRSRKEGAANAPGRPVDSDVPSSELTPTDQIERALQEIDAALREALLARIRTASPVFFERLVVDLLVAMGYGEPEDGKHLGKPGDGGVDGVINLDKLGLDKVYIQAKRYAAGNTIGRPDIQSFFGALEMYGTTRGVFVTTSAFSAEARAFADSVKSKNIVLIDGEQLATLLIQHDVAVRADRAITLKRLDEDYFEG